MKYVTIRQLDNLKSHAEFISASSTQTVLPSKQQRQALKILKQVQDDFFNSFARATSPGSSFWRK